MIRPARPSRVRRSASGPRVLAIVLLTTASGSAGCPAPAGRPAPSRPDSAARPPTPDTPPRTFCAALARRATACPAERLDPRGCAHDDRCLSRLLRPDAHATFVGCYASHPCLPPGGIEAACRGVLSALQPSPIGVRVRRACAARACGDRAASHCALAPWFHDRATAEILGCLDRASCDAVGRCTEHTLDRWGCP